MFGDSGVENAPYTVIKSIGDPKIEVRNYSSMVLVSAPMVDGERGDAFRALFDYISGANTGQSEIAMTAPVLMDEDGSGQKIPMTAPVFMDEDTQNRMMSFVMPDDFTLDSTPAPTNPLVKVSEFKDYQVAVIRFNGFLNDANIDKHRNILEQWVLDNGYVVTGAVKSAGYNAPFTLPAMRRNEVLIPVGKKN